MQLIAHTAERPRDRTQHRPAEKHRDRQSDGDEPKHQILTLGVRGRQVREIVASLTLQGLVKLTELIGQRVGRRVPSAVQELPDGDPVAFLEQRIERLHVAVHLAPERLRRLGQLPVDVFLLSGDELRPGLCDTGGGAVDLRGGVLAGQQTVGELAGRPHDGDRVGRFDALEIARRHHAVFEDVLEGRLASLGLQQRLEPDAEAYRIGHQPQQDQPGLDGRETPVERQRAHRRITPFLAWTNASRKVGSGLAQARLSRA